MFKNLIFIFGLFLITNQANAQKIYISGGMGLNYSTMETLNDYLRYNWGFNNRKDESHSAIEFFAAVGSNLTYNVLFEASFGYSLNSFNKNSGLGSYQFEYSFYLPEFLILYDLPSKFYGFQLGAGIGYYLGKVDEIPIGTTQTRTEETKGLGFQLKSVFYTSFSKDLVIEISANYRKAFLNDLSNFNMNIFPYQPLNLSFNSLGIKLGVRYFL